MWSGERRRRGHQGDSVRKAAALAGERHVTLPLGNGRRAPVESWQRASWAKLTKRGGTVRASREVGVNSELSGKIFRPAWRTRHTVWIAPSR